MHEGKPTGNNHEPQDENSADRDQHGKIKHSDADGVMDDAGRQNLLASKGQTPYDELYQGGNIVGQNIFDFPQRKHDLSYGAKPTDDNTYIGSYRLRGLDYDGTPYVINTWGLIEKSLNDVGISYDGDTDSSGDTDDGGNLIDIKIEPVTYKPDIPSGKLTQEDFDEIIRERARQRRENEERKRALRQQEYERERQQEHERLESERRKAEADEIIQDSLKWMLKLRPDRDDYLDGES